MGIFINSLFYTNKLCSIRFLRLGQLQNDETNCLILKRFKEDYKIAFISFCLEVLECR